MILLSLPSCLNVFGTLGLAFGIGFWKLRVCVSFLRCFFLLPSCLCASIISCRWCRCPLSDSSVGPQLSCSFDHAGTSVCPIYYPQELAVGAQRYFCLSA